MKNKRTVLPNFFTLTNAFLGFVAILHISEGRFTTAAWYIAFAAVCDGLDGMLARLSKTNSKFGIQLDSLADMVSFGIAPAFLVYKTNFSTAGVWGALFCFIFTLAGIFRLARFNVTASVSKKKCFKGLPIPVAALAISAFFIMAQHFWDTVQMAPVLLTLLPGLSLLMVSTIEYEPLPSLMLHRSLRKNLKPIFYIIGFVAVLVNPKVWFFPYVMAYILVYLVKGILIRFRAEDEETEVTTDEENLKS